MRCRSHLQAGIVSRPQFGLALLLALGSGCSGSPSSETGSPSSETGCTARSVEVAQQHIDLMARGEIQEAAELVEPSTVDERYGYSLPDGQSGVVSGTDDGSPSEDQVARFLEEAVDRGYDLAGVTVRTTRIDADAGIVHFGLSLGDVGVGKGAVSCRTSRIVVWVHGPPFAGRG